MNTEQVKEIANKELSEVLAQGMTDVFEVISGSLLCEEKGESCSFEYEIVFKYGNIKRTHAIIIGWNEVDGVGLEYGEDSQIMPITYGEVMASMYFDMAMAGLDDKYVA